MDGPYTEPLYCVDKPPDSLQLVDSSVDYGDEEGRRESLEGVITARWKSSEPDDKVTEANPDLSSSPLPLTCEPSRKRGSKITTVPELELRKLEQGEDLTHALLSCCFGRTSDLLLIFLHPPRLQIST